MLMYAYSLHFNPSQWVIKSDSALQMLWTAAICAAKSCLAWRRWHYFRHHHPFRELSRGAARAKSERLWNEINLWRQATTSLAGRRAFAHFITVQSGCLEGEAICKRLCHPMMCQHTSSWNLEKSAKLSQPSSHVYEPLFAIYVSVGAMWYDVCLRVFPLSCCHLGELVSGAGTRVLPRLEILTVTNVFIKWK